MTIIQIKRKKRSVFVRQMTVGELDKSKCSARFLAHNLPNDTVVNVKCDEYGTLDLRGKAAEYRIIVSDGVLKDTRPIGTKPQNKNNKQRLFILSIDFIFKYIEDHPEATRMNYGGYCFSLRRIIVHKAIGVVCVNCGLEGYHYALEQWYDGSLHLDLYAKLPNGSERLMTIDHIIPKSKGGPNVISNYQMMCCTCNQKKGNNIIVQQKSHQS